MRMQVTKLLGVLTAAVALSACGGQAMQKQKMAKTPTLEELTPGAVAAMKGFGGALKGELTGAMKAGGPANALQVCNQKAAGIAEAKSKESGYNLSRVAVKNRNPDQHAVGWAREVLDKFEARKAAGEPVDKLAYKAIVDTDNGKEFRMMKAIPTGGVCLICHGESVDPGLNAKIKALYPGDTATGFKAGDIRGAFVITKPL